MIQKLPSQEEIEDLLEENARLTETEKSLKDTTDKVLDQNDSLKEDFSRVRIPSGDTLDMTHTCGLACEKCGFVSQVHRNVVFFGFIQPNRNYRILAYNQVIRRWHKNMPFSY